MAKKRKKYLTHEQRINAFIPQAVALADDSVKRKRSKNTAKDQIYLQEFNTAWNKIYLAEMNRLTIDAGLRGEVRVL